MDGWMVMLQLAKQSKIYYVDIELYKDMIRKALHIEYWDSSNDINELTILCYKSLEISLWMIETRRKKNLDYA